MNTLSYIFLLAIVAGFTLQWLLTQRHIKHVAKHRGQVPEAFSDNIPLQDHQKAADYTRAKALTGLAELCIATLVLLVWTFGGGLQWLDSLWRNAALSDIITASTILWVTRTTVVDNASHTLRSSYLIAVRVISSSDPRGSSISSTSGSTTSARAKATRCLMPPES